VASFTLLALQATGVLTPQPDERLLHPVPAAHCRRSGEEIVVCGHGVDAYRLPNPDPPTADKGQPKAEWGLIGDAKLGVSATQRTLGPMSAPAVMVTVTIPF
jgi:hypothetical protein